MAARQASAPLVRGLVALLTTLALALLVVPPAHAAPRVSVTLKVGWQEFRAGESVRLSGTVKIGGKRAAKGTAVGILREDLRTGKSGKVATVRVNASGNFAVRIRPANDTTYTVRVDGKHRSRSVTVRKESGNRSLASRTKAVPTLGKAKGKAAALSQAQRSDLGAAAQDAVRYRNFAKGLLVEVSGSKGTNTWLVSGKIRTLYLKNGGPTGKYGVPVADARCGLIETGCLQRFSNGAIYSKASKKRAYGQTGKTKATELLAVGRSQVGYTEPKWRNSKYNRWIKSVGAPWCSAFQSWLSVASGNGKLIPKHKRLAQLTKDVKKNNLTYTNASTKHSPKRGTLVFFDFRNAGRGPEPSHIGILISQTATTVTTLEGNASKGGNFGSKRGVFIHERPKNRVLFYADPNW